MKKIKKAYNEVVASAVMSMLHWSCCEEGANYNLIQSNFSQSIFQHHLFGFWAHSFRLGEKSGEELLLLHIKRSVSKGVLWHLIRIIPGRLPVEVFKARQT